MAVWSELASGSWSVTIQPDLIIFQVFAVWKHPFFDVQFRLIILIIFFWGLHPNNQPGVWMSLFLLHLPSGYLFLWLGPIDIHDKWNMYTWLTMTDYGYPVGSMNLCLKTQRFFAGDERQYQVGALSGAEKSDCLALRPGDQWDFGWYIHWKTGDWRLRSWGYGRDRKCSICMWKTPGAQTSPRLCKVPSAFLFLVDAGVFESSNLSWKKAATVLHIGYVHFQLHMNWNQMKQAEYGSCVLQYVFVYYMYGGFLSHRGTPNSSILMGFPL